ncbi:MAG: DnaJ C-terminal domain-containing protein [Chthoniobacterales bacterium]
MRRDHYGVLGVERGCPLREIRGAFRILIKRWHPDVCDDPDLAAERSRELTEAYETLSDPVRRAAHDAELAGDEPTMRAPSGRTSRDVKQDVFVSAEELIRGTWLDVRIDDPANPGEIEHYQLEIFEGIHPGERFRIPRNEPFAGGSVIVRVKVRPDARFRASGSDLKTTLRISGQRASSGGTERIPGPTGGMLSVSIPSGVARGTVLKLPGEGLPKSRGGRGDLLVKIDYRVNVRVTRGGAPQVSERSLLRDPSAEF